MQRKNIRDKYMSVEYNINRGGWIEAATGATELDLYLV